MAQYFDMIDDTDRHGLFDSVGDPVTLLKATSRSPGDTEAEVATIDGKVQCIVLGGLAREEGGYELSALCDQ